MADLGISIEINARQTKKGAEEAKSALKGVGDQAENTGKRAKNAADRDIAGLNTQLGGLSKIGGLVTMGVAAIGAAIAAAAAVAAKAAKVIFDLSKSFADYVTDVKRANEMTGLSVRLLSALKAQSDLTGRSFDEIGTGIKNFTKLIGDANNGKKEAIEKMARLGIDAKKAAADLQGAFQQAVRRVLELPPGVQQATAAIDAFGEEGVKLLPFLKEFGGDLTVLEKKAADLGLILSDADVKAAAEFNKAFSEVQALLRSLGLTFGREFMPIVRDVLRDVGGWIRDNRRDIGEWATYSADLIRGVIRAFTELVDFVQRNQTAIRVVLGVATLGASEAAIFTIGKAGESLDKLAELGKTRRGVYEPFIDAPTRIEGMNYNTGGSYFTLPPENVVQTAKAVRAATPPRIELTAEQKQAERLKEIISDLRKEIEFFDRATEVSKIAQEFWEKSIAKTNVTLSKQAVAAAKDLDDKRKAAEFAKELATIAATGRDQRTGLQGTLAELEQQIALGRELTDVERTLIENKQALILLQHQLEDAKKSDEEISKLVQELREQQALTLTIQQSIQAKREQIAAEQAYKNLIVGLDSEIFDLTIQLQEYTTGMQASRVAILQLTEAYKQLTPEQQKAASQKVAEIDGLRESIKAQEEARRAYDEMYGTIRDSLQVLSEQGFGAFFKNIYRKFKDFLLDMVTEWITSKFFQMFFKGGNQSQAQASGSGGGIFSGILNGIFGGQGQGPGGTPTFAGGSGGGFNIGSLFGGGNRTGSITTLPNGEQAVNVNGSGGGRLAGALGLAGAGASILGGAIGGRVGGFISNIGTGVALGAQIGSIIPGIGTAIGAVVGGAVGFFASLFGGDPKRKRDKNEKIPALNKGFTDALKELRDLVGDVRTLRVSPDSAIARATELRNQIAAGFGLEFESKKYRKQARTLITQRTREADALIAELRNAAEIANAAGERQRRLIPEFAGGVFMSRDFTKQLGEFKRMNGMMAGRYTGIDTINARIGAGEMVLNPRQQQNVRSNAGLDPFRNAGIPGYAGGGAVGGGQSASGSSPEPMNMTFVFEHSIDAAGMVRTSLKNSPDVKREVRVVVEDLAENDRLKLQRRGL